VVKTSIVLFCSRRTLRIFYWGGGGEGVWEPILRVYVYIYIYNLCLILKIML